MDYGQACRQTFIYRITEGLPVIRPEIASKRLELRTFNALTSQALRVVHALQGCLHRDAPRDFEVRQPTKRVAASLAL